MKGRVEVSPRERILQNGAELFAQKGFSAVGVREVTDRAGVNVSMTSYYYGGKSGLLKAILTDFFKRTNDIIKEVSAMNLTADNKIRELVKLLLDMMMANKNICRVAIFELPFEIPEVSEFKEELFKETIKITIDILKDKYNIKEESLQLIVGPAFYSLLFSHCYYSNVLHQDVNSKYFKKYAETISELFLRGIACFENKKK